MATKVRVMASLGSPDRDAQPPVIYRAQAYDDLDTRRNALWGCQHEHETVEEALLCGMEWIDTQDVVDRSS